MAVRDTKMKILPFLATDLWIHRVPSLFYLSLFAIPSISLQSPTSAGNSAYYPFTYHPTDSPKLHFANSLSNPQDVEATTKTTGVQSKRVFYDVKSKTPKLVYSMDKERNRIPDFSYAGYKNGNITIPNIRTRFTLSPPKDPKTDCTKFINDAIIRAAASTSPIDPKTPEFKGAVYLKPGIYRVKGTLRVPSGIVLRGASDGDDPKTNTIIEAIGNAKEQPNVILAGTGRRGWSPIIKDSEKTITTKLVDIGSRKFQVDDVSPYKVGDTIVIDYSFSEQFLRAINYGDTSPNWKVNSDSVQFNRNIIHIDKKTKTITIDTPLSEKLDSKLSKAKIWKYETDRYATHLGVERLRVRIMSPKGPTDEDHASNGILLMGVDNAWVRNCTVSGFVRSGVVTNTATRVSVLDSKSIDPFGRIIPNNMYNFAAETSSNLILFQNVFARNGRHHFVVNGAAKSSNVVFQNCVSTKAHSTSEGHRRWSTGILYDNCVFDTAVETRAVALYNRGTMGSSHGWSAAHSVAWKVSNYRPGTKTKSGFVVVQKPPTAQNYAIGCAASSVTGKKPPAPFAQPNGWIENIDNLFPYSLYYAQLGERLNKDVGGIFKSKSTSTSAPKSTSTTKSTSSGSVKCKRSIDDEPEAEEEVSIAGAEKTNAPTVIVTVTETMTSSQNCINDSEDEDPVTTVPVSTEAPSANVTHPLIPSSVFTQPPIATNTTDIVQPTVFADMDTDEYWEKFEFEELTESPETDIPDEFDLYDTTESELQGDVLTNVTIPDSLKSPHLDDELSIYSDRETDMASSLKLGTESTCSENTINHDSGSSESTASIGIAGSLSPGLIGLVVAGSVVGVAGVGVYKRRSKGKKIDEVDTESKTESGTGVEVSMGENVLAKVKSRCRGNPNSIQPVKVEEKSTVLGIQNNNVRQVEMFSTRTDRVRSATHDGSVSVVPTAAQRTVALLTVTQLDSTDEIIESKEAEVL
ncbi:hypothetical protein BKA69DRAFT_1123529 [Paraphysoderma sedebokerense]|nr:hypothetical protein BKA69DRAFT_1123529 [Paraphysoderma sedebokerense]